MHIPRKRFGQHFLRDKAIISRIVASLSPKKGEHLVEIGPGQGAITVPVLREVGYLEAVELDRDLISELTERTRHAGELLIYSADALTFDFASIKKDKRLLRIFGNLPYNISTPLIFHLLSFAPVVSDMLFMLQKEVAERLAAKPATPDYGRLSVMAQYHCQVDLLFDVPATAFYPPPQVRSSIVRLMPYREPPYPANHYSTFESIVKHAFGQRRKTLRNSLKNLIDDSAWAHIETHSNLRPEELHVKDFVEISNAIGNRE